MGLGQGAAERSRRNPSISGEPEPRQDPEAQRNAPPQKDKEGTNTGSSQDSPRGCHASPQSAPSSIPLAPIPNSNASTPVVASVDAFINRNITRTPPQGSIDPPITKNTLSELDVQKIFHNPKLRHDINFDPDLHFRPNVEGEKGRKKQERSDCFWRTLRDQLSDFVVNREKFYAQFGHGDEWCLPVLLKTIRDILHTLVPQRDRQFLDEGLNVSLKMQQFHKGVLDLDQLALWLSGVLKSHCAPMRDEEVDTMYNYIKTGNQTGDLDQLVLGMRELLSVLEHMKLDVANHQIRCLRPALIDDTIHFEQKYFCKRLQSGKLDTRESILWYRNAQRLYSNGPSDLNQGFGEMHILFEALSRLVLPSASRQKIPETFQHDHERIIKLRADILDAINMDICMRLYEDLEKLGRLTSSVQFQSYNDASSKASSRVPSGEFSFTASLPGSRPSSLAVSSAGSAASSPRSSLAMPSYVAPEQHESRARTQNLYQSLLALLHQAPHAANQAARWQAIAPSMALQIFRYTSAPSGMLPVYEEKLMNNLCRPDSPLYCEMEQKFQQRLLAELSNRVREFKGLSGVSLYSAATEARIMPTSSRLFDHDDESGIEDMATRLAHVGILHWRVWAPLVYVEDVDVPMI